MKVVSLEDLRRLRRTIHQNPELSLKEFKTSEFIRSELEKLGLDYETPMETATISFIEGRDNSRTVLLRADIDALPITEDNSLEYKSKNIGVMHACGHDAHAAMLLAATKEILNLKKNNDLGINVLIVFQPSEESFGGANVLVRKYDFRRHNIIASYALHVNPDFNEGEIVTRVGNIMASCNEFTVDVRGRASHVGIREKGIDAINACVQIYQQFQAIPTYDLDSKNVNIIHVGKMNVGEVMNSVPENGHMEGTIRTYRSEDLEISKERMRHICEGVSISTNCKVEVNFKDGYPALSNDEELIDRVKSCAEKRGIVFSLKKYPYLMGEDFTFFSEISPLNFSFVGIRNENLGYTSGLHTPGFKLREEALISGIDFLVEVVKSYG